MLNWPNGITVLRIVLIPVFLGLLMLYTPGREWLRWAAIGVFAAAGLSDALDGHLARRFGQQSRVGALLDPLADKLLVNLAFVFLAVHEVFGAVVPMWVPVLVLLRDAGITGVSFYIDKYRGPLVAHPRVLGKAATAIRCAAILVVLLRLPYAHETLLVMVAFEILSAVDYLFFGWEAGPDRKRMA